MKTPEERLTRGKGKYSNCTDYDDAIKVIKEYAIEYHEQHVKMFWIPTLLPELESIVIRRAKDMLDSKLLQQRYELLITLDALKRLIPSSYFERKARITPSVKESDDDFETFYRETYRPLFLKSKCIIENIVIISQYIVSGMLDKAEFNTLLDIIKSMERMGYKIKECQKMKGIDLVHFEYIFEIPEEKITDQIINLFEEFEGVKVKVVNYIKFLK